MLVNLTYPLRPGMPIYPGAPEPVIAPHRTIRQGFNYNSYKVTLWNHSGTHVDAPRHVYDDGPCISDYGLGELIFTRPVAADVSPPKDGLIKARHLESVLEAGSSWDFVVLRTGFGRFRDEDPQRYATANPGLGEEAAFWLVENVPHLRGVALDTISLTPAAHPDEGWRAHRILLHPVNRRVVVEDVYLPEGLPPLEQLWVVPLSVEGVDSTWCTVFAEVEKEG